MKGETVRRKRRDASRNSTDTSFLRCTLQPKRTLFEVANVLAKRRDLDDSGPRVSLLRNVQFDISLPMPRKIRELISDLEQAGFCEVAGGKGSHREFRHLKFPGAALLSGKIGDDAHHDQEKQVRNAIALTRK
jgi:predicted RNA binding protein YcfA (HicA-like mRNA interferase family)